jgi:hypothetical protein
MAEFLPSFLSMLFYLGAAALHVASKCEDVSYIGIKDLVSSSDDGIQSTGMEIT